MIYLYSGSPGSGKSLHAASEIYKGLKKKDALYIGNFGINETMFSELEILNWVELRNDVLVPENLIRIAEAYHFLNPIKSVNRFERSIRLYIDEAQIIFNSRNWQKQSNSEWGKFFGVHRHYGYEVTLISQGDYLLDKQCRGVIEYEFRHRKIANIGTAGFVLALFFGGGLFYCNRLWYPGKEPIGGSFFRFHHKFSDLYDTHASFAFDSGANIATESKAELAFFLKREEIKKEILEDGKKRKIKKTDYIDTFDIDTGYE